MVNIGARHIAGKVNLVKNNKVYRWVIGLKIKSGCQRIGSWKILEGAISIYCDLCRNSISSIPVNHSIEWIAGTKFSCLSGRDRTQQHREKEQSSESDQRAARCQGIKGISTFAGFPIGIHLYQLAYQSQHHGYMFY